MEEEQTMIFTLKYIETKEFEVNSHFSPLNDEILKSSLAFGFAAPDQDGKNLNSSFRFQLLSENRPFITIQVTCIFDINPNEIVYNNEKNDVIIPKKIAIQLSNIVMGTTRGILFAKTKGTSLSQYSIPITDASKHITEDARLPNID